jgi:hypothetical protein
MTKIVEFFPTPWTVATIIEAKQIIDDLSLEFLFPSTSLELEVRLAEDVDMIETYGIESWRHDKYRQIIRREDFFEGRTEKFLEAEGLKVPTEWLNELIEHHHNIIIVNRLRI